MEVKKNLMFKMMRNRSLLFFVIALLLIISGPGCKPKPEQVQPNPHLLVTPVDIERNKDEWIVLDCRDKASYDEGHIPGAISLGGRCHVLIRDTEKIIPIVGEMYKEYDYSPNSPIKVALDDGRLGKKTLIASLALRPIEELEKLFAQAGITHNKTVVIYSDAHDIIPGYHAVPFFTLEYLGHPDVRILDGGFEAWTAEGSPIEQKENKLPPTDFNANVVKSRLATVDEVAKIAKEQAKDVQLVDSRLIDEYLGKSVAPPNHFLTKAAGRAGRIPNTTLNVPHFLQFTDMKTLKVKPLERLDRMYLTLDKNKRTVLYCYIANRISFSYFVLRLLGFKDVAIYHDSWIVYSNDKSLPVEKGPR